MLTIIKRFIYLFYLYILESHNGHRKKISLDSAKWWLYVCPFLIGQYKKNLNYKVLGLLLEK